MYIRASSGPALWLGMMICLASVMGLTCDGVPGASPIPGAGIGVRLMVDNQSSLAVVVEAVYTDDDREVRRTVLLLGVDGASTSGGVLRTVADTVSVTSRVAEATADLLPRGIEPGQLISQRQFVLSVDYNDGETITFIVPVIDPAARVGDDCNHNGTPDDVEIAENPDLDCNTNGIPDDCDISADDPDGNDLVSADCDGDATPDECQSDADGDGVIDACDACPNDPDKTTPGACGCGVPDTDTDQDGTPDCLDGCPFDPGKTDPGQCDCGLPDDDADGDGTADCADLCPNDPAKTDPGTCGCGNADTDADLDGVPDCVDGCPLDPNKTEPGFCGCGVPDADADGDETPDCLDGCPTDPRKTDPGLCGCGVMDDLTDDDKDGVPNCLDVCPLGDDTADCDGNGVPDACDDGARIYWTENDIKSPGEIRSTQTDGSCAARQHPSSGAFLGEIDIDLTPGEERMFWLDLRGIDSADLGGFKSAMITTFAPDLGGGIAVDHATRFLYWTQVSVGFGIGGDSDGNFVSLNRLDLNATAPTPQRLLSGPGTFPGGLAVDTSLNVAFWSQQDGLGTGHLLRVNPNATNPTSTVIRSAGNGVLIRGVAIDPTAQRVYWTEWDGADSVIRRADFDGNIDEGDDPVIAQTGLLADQLVLDLAASPAQIYWTTPSFQTPDPGQILRAGLDGSNIEVFQTTGLALPSGIALKPAGIPVPNPGQ